MEFLFFTRMLCISLSLLLTPCASLLNDQLHSSHDRGHEQQLTLPKLPRKLKLNEVSNVKSDEVHKGLNEQMEVLSGKSHQKEAQMMHAAAAKRQEWIKGSESGDMTSQFFTMDYSHVRRRRPIHNKSLPVAP